MSKIAVFGMAAVIAIMGMVMGTVAEDAGDGDFDGAAPHLVMSASQNSITIENWGTAPAQVGGLRLITKVGNVCTDVATMPWNVCLRPEPFPTKGAQNNDYKITLATNQNLTTGDTVYLTNGVGNYATAVVA